MWGVGGADGDDDANETHDKLGGKTMHAQQSAYFYTFFRIQFKLSFPQYEVSFQAAPPYHLHPKPPFNPSKSRLHLLRP